MSQKSTLYIRVNGKEYPCRISMGALVRFKRETGKEISQLSADDISEMIVFIWCCVKSACNADGVEFQMNPQDFADAVDVDSINDFLSMLNNEGQKKSSGGENEGIESQLGFALGCVGMSLDDFDRCTPTEFEAVVENWRKARESISKDGWEQARFMATLFVQSYSKKNIRPTDIIEFEWDKKSVGKAEKSTRSRMEEMKKRCR